MGSQAWLEGLSGAHGVTSPMVRLSRKSHELPQDHFLHTGRVAERLKTRRIQVNGYCGRDGGLGLIQLGVIGGGRTLNGKAADVAPVDALVVEGGGFYGSACLAECAPRARHGGSWGCSGERQD